MERILIAYDGGAPARRALELAADLATKFGASVGVVSVVPYDPGRSPVAPWDDGTTHAQELQEARAYLLEHKIEAEFLEPSGDPATTIERIAANGHFDTVVIGSRGLGPLSRFLQGSVSEHVATHAEATVIVAR
jgi:nucleotide-binding universal stress UspA family protein